MRQYETEVRNFWRASTNIRGLSRTVCPTADDLTDADDSLSEIDVIQAYTDHANLRLRCMEIRAQVWLGDQKAAVK